MTENLDFELKNSGYINQLPIVKQDNITSDYLMLQDVKNCENSNEETAFLSVNLKTDEETHNKCNQESEILCSGYISVEIANS